MLQPLTQQGHPEQGAQGHVQAALGDPQGGDPTASGQPVPVLRHCTAQKGSWCSEGTSCAPVCAHGLWSWHWAPLTEPGSGLWDPSLRDLWTLMRSPRASSSPAEQSQLSQPLFTGEVLQTLNHLHSPLPNTTKDTISLLSGKCALLTCVQLALQKPKIVLSPFL